MSDIISAVNGENEDDFEELEYIDRFSRDNGEEKYRYINSVYLHKPSGEHICVECQHVNDRECDFISFVGARTVKKKEVVTYEWS